MSVNQGDLGKNNLTDVKNNVLSMIVCAFAFFFDNKCITKRFLVQTVLQSVSVFD